MVYKYGIFFYIFQIYLVMFIYFSNFMDLLKKYLLFTYLMLNCVLYCFILDKINSSIFWSFLLETF